MAGWFRLPVLFGAILQKLVLMIPWFGHHTDSVAFTVFIAAT